MTTSVAAFGGQYSFTPSSTNPLFTGGSPLAPANVSLATFLAAGETFQIEFLKAAAEKLGSTTSGIVAYGLRFDSAGGERTFILSANADAVIAVDQLTASSYSSLDPSDRQAVLSTGALSVTPFADDFAAQTPSFRLAFVQANGNSIGSVAPKPFGLSLPESGGDRIFVVNNAGNDVIDVGQLDLKAYVGLASADRTLARLSGGLSLSPTAFEFRSITASQQADYLNTFGVTIAMTAGGEAVKGLFLIDSGGQSAFILSQSGAAIDLGAMSFSAFNALSDSDRARALATGVLRIDPTASEFRAASSTDQKRFLDLFGTVLGKTLVGAEVKGMVFRDSAGAQAFLNTSSGVIDVATIAPTLTAFNSLSLDIRNLIASTGTLPFLASLEVFQSWPSASQLAYLTDNVLSLGVPTGGSGSVSGLTLRGPEGPATYILSASGVMIDPTTVSFSAFAAISPSPSALTESERRAIATLRGGMPTPTPAELKSADASVQLMYVSSAKAQLGVTASGSAIQGVRLSDGVSDGSFILSADGTRVIDVTSLTLGEFLGLSSADQQRVHALPEFQSSLTSASFRAATAAQRLAYLTAFGVTLGATTGGDVVKGVRLADGSDASTFILSSAGDAAIDVSRLSLAGFIALALADRQLISASGAFKPSLAEFLALDDLKKGSAIEDLGEDLGTIAPSTPVKGLRFTDASGTRTFVRSADGARILEPNALSLDAYAALSSADRVLVLAAGAFTGGMSTEAFQASSTIAQLIWMADQGQRLGALPDGTVITGVVLDGAAGRTAFVRGASGTTIVNVSSLSPPEFMSLSAADRALVAGSNMFRPSLDAFNALSSVLQIEFVKQASSANVLTVVAADGDHRIIVNSAGAGIIDTGALTFTGFYGLSAADRALVLASGGYAPNPTLAEFKAAATSVQMAHIDLVGYQAGTLASGATIKAITLSDGLTRSMFIVNSAGSNVIDVLATSSSAFVAMAQGDRDRVFATGQFTGVPTAAALRANPSLVTANAVTLGYTAANTPVLGLIAADGDKQTLFVIDSANTVIEPGQMTTAQLDALSSSQRDYVRSVVSYLPAGLIPPYFRDANARDPSDPTTGELGELIRVRETKELYATTYLDGDTRKLANNPLTGLTLSSPTFLNTFLQAHTAHQLEYIKANGTTITYTDATGTSPVTYTTKALNIVVGSDTLTYMVSADGASIINVAKLSIGAMARLSQADQALVSKTTGYTQIAASLGLTADSGTGDERLKLKTLVSDLQKLVSQAFDTAPITQEMKDASAVFTQQLTLIQERLDNTVVFSISALQTKLSEISQRFNRIKAYVDTLKLAPDEATALKHGLDFKGLTEGLQSFIREEKRIAVNDTRIARLTRLAKLGIPDLDLPSLIVEFQTLYEIDSRARADADTVEVKQQNAMLSDYNEYQRIITLTAGSFPAKDDGKTALAIKDETLNTRIKNMFDSRWGTIKHPIETLTGTTRPTQYTAQLTFNFTMFAFDAEGNADNQEIGPEFLGELQSQLNITLPYSNSPWIPDYLRSLTNMDAFIHQVFDDTNSKALLNDLEVIQDDDAFAANRAAVMEALGLNSTFTKNDFKNMVKDWKNEVEDFERTGTLHSFSTFFLRWLEKKDADSSWTRVYFPQWVSDNYYRDNNDKGDKLTYGELTLEATRPLVYKALKRKVDWDNIGTQLTNAITNINQSNQIRQNSISQYQSEATRHFDLVNNTLKRMFDLMQTIGRNAA
jgi:hypothetical protein